MAPRSADVRHSQTLAREIHVLRWIYERDDESLTCELALARDLAAYELRFSLPRLAEGPGSEMYDDAISAFQRQAIIERGLIEEGWSLEDFQKDRLLF
jgi:hypothetical protein